MEQPKVKKEVVDLTKLPIILIEPKKKLKGETKSKFIDPDSDLYFHIYDCQMRIKQAGIRFDCKLEPHVELVDNKDSLDTFLSRSKELHMKMVDVTNKSNYKIKGKVLVMCLPSITDKQDLCIKIAHFQYLPPHIDKLTGIIFNKDYSPYSEWEQTVFD
jgi:hypothetical protein